MEELWLETGSGGRFRALRFCHANSIDTSPQNHPQRVFVLCHGAGYTAESFTLCATAIAQLDTDAHVIAIDARGHGRTAAVPDASGTAANKFALEAMSRDLLDCLHVYNKSLSDRPTSDEKDKTVSITNESAIYLLVGHSMGGAIAVHAAKLLHTAQVDDKEIHIGGVGVIDVVEGSAMEALDGMQRLIDDRPHRFHDKEEAIQWSLRNSGSVRNQTSARISIPAQLMPDPQNLSSGMLKWRTDIAETQPFWHEWFEGLSQKFLSLPCAKLLVLANTDRLDTPLTIAQMQGKFRMEIVSNAAGNVGHAVHEDEPFRTAQIIVEFASMCGSVRRVPMPGGGFKTIRLGVSIK